MSDSENRKTTSAIRLGSVSVQGAVTLESKAPPPTLAENDDSEDSGNEAQAKLLDERTFEDQKRVEVDRNATVDTSHHLLEDVPLDATELELTHARIKTLKGMDFQPYSGTLTRICLRQNEIPSLIVKEDGAEVVAPLSNLSVLEEIDLYDNKIKEIDGLEGLPKLKSLDLSFNLIKKINTHLSAPGNALRSSLTHLYFVQNKISRIDHLEGLEAIEYLELGGNRIRTIENLTPLSKTLTQLWLGKNKITSLSGLEELVNLRVLSIQSNRITEIGNHLRTLVNLEELYLSHNGLTELDGLEENKKLTILDIAANRISKICSLSHLTLLEDFWANNNKIAHISHIPLSEKHNLELSTVYFEGNPFERDEGTAYRRKLMLMLPQVKQIDAAYVRN